MIDRIAKLLAKAEQAATPAEAQAYFDKAQALATAHSISLAKARLHDTQRHHQSAPLHKTVRVGPPRRHANRHLVMLMSALARANDLRVDIAHNSTFVVLYGFADDIAAVETLWSRISTQMVRFGEQFLATGGWRSDQRIVAGRYLAPMTKQSARAQYYSSFIAAVSERIQRARESVVAESARDDDHRARGGGATAVALRAKDLAVGDYYTHTSDARGSWRGGRSSVVGLSRAAASAGSRDGRRVALGDQQNLPGPPSAVGR